MYTTLISENAFEAGRGGRSKAAGGCDCFELVRAFGDRIYSIANHITQSEDDAGDVLIDAFLQVCSDSDGCQDHEKIWLRLVTIAVRGAFSKLYSRREGTPPLDGIADSREDLVVLELSVWGDTCQDRVSQAQTTGKLEQSLRSLDAMCRTVFVLRDIEEISVGQIASIVGRSVAAVEVCLLRARLQLRETLARQMRQHP
jgi:RNA polymerase sigma-70 factor, ECF subfamily